MREKRRLVGRWLLVSVFVFVFGGHALAAPNEPVIITSFAVSPYTARPGTPIVVEFSISSDKKVTPQWVEVRIGCGDGLDWNSTAPIVDPIQPWTGQEGQVNEKTFSTTWDTTGYAPGLYTVWIRIGHYKNGVWSFITQDSALVVLEEPQVSPILVVHPDTLNTKSQGNPVIAYVYHPDVADLGALTLYVQKSDGTWSSAIPFEEPPKPGLERYGEDLLRYMAQFNREFVISQLDGYEDNAVVTFVANFTIGANTFEVTDTIRLNVK